MTQNVVSKLGEAKLESPAETVLPINNTETPAPEKSQLGDRSKLGPAKLLAPKRKVDLSTVSMASANDFAAVETLEVREMKGIGSVYTPHTERALVFRGLVYKPEGEFDAVHQIVAGPLLQDPRLLARTKVITFAPAFSWSTFSMVIIPYRMSKYGARVLQAIQSLQPRFPEFKIFVEWDEIKKRHVVRNCPMLAQERELIRRSVWPTKEEILSTLEIVAFDNLDDLAAANDDIRRLLQSEEV